MAVAPYIQRQIEQITNDAVIQKRVERKFIGAGSLITGGSDLQVGAKYYTFPVFNVQGRAALIANNAFDVGSVDAFVSERTQNIELLYIPWSVNFTEQEHANFAGIGSIQGYSIPIAIEAMYNRIDEMGYIGEPTVGLYGLANNPNVATVTLPNDGTGATTEFANKTPEQVLRDLNSIAYSVSRSTLHAYNTTTIAVPPSVWDQIFNRILSASGTTQSVLTTFRQNQEQVEGNVKIRVAPGLEWAGAGGTPLIIAYNDRSDYVKYLKTGLKRRPLHSNVEGTKSAMYCYLGAVLIKQPLSLIYVTGAA